MKLLQCCVAVLVLGHSTRSLAQIVPDGTSSEEITEILQIQDDFDLESAPTELQEAFPSSIDLTRINPSDFDQFNRSFKTDLEKIQKHIEKWGEPLSRYELYAMNLNSSTIDFLWDKIRINSEPKINWSELLKLSLWKTEFIQSYRFKLPLRNGFERNDSLAFLGNTLWASYRFKSTLNEVAQVGVILEKDPGEPFVNPSNYLPPLLKFSLRLGSRKSDLSLVIGSFRRSYGLNVVQLNSAFYGGSLVKPNQNTFAPDLSRTEFNRRNGIAVRKKLKDWKLDLMLSHSGQSARVDSLGRGTSVIGNGLHRNQKELRMQSQLETIEAHLVAQKSGFGFGYLFTQPNRDMIQQEDLWRVHKPATTPQHYIHAFHHGHIGNVYHQGELALGSNGSYSGEQVFVLYPDGHWRVDLSVASSSLNWPGSDKRSQLSILTTYQPRRYLSVSFRLGRRLDHWPGLSKSDIGHRQISRISLNWRVRKGQELRANIQNAETSEGSRSAISLIYKHKLSPGSELRGGYYLNRSKDIELKRTTGNLFFTEMRYKTPRRKLQLQLRHCVFSSDSYANRFSLFENQLLHSYSLTSLQHSGTRFFILAAWKPKPKWTIRIRYARTNFADEIESGSGPDLIVGNHRSEMSGQIQLKF